jgi:hypothetical protein
VAGRYDISAWVTKAKATCLVEGFEEGTPALELPRNAIASLDAMLADRPTPAAVEGYLVSTGETSAEGTNRARRWYEEILQGKRLRDYRGRTIWPPARQLR